MFRLLRRYSPVALLHLYVALRLVPDLIPADPPAVAAFIGVLLASSVLIPFSFFVRHANSKSFSLALAWAGLIAMGMFSSLFVLTLLRDVLLIGGLTLSVFFTIDEPLQRFREASALAVPAIAALFSAVGFFNARRRASVRSVDVPIANLPIALHGFTIAQISDVHIGTTIKGRHLSAIVDAVNELKPDMVAITGDLVDGSVAELSAHTECLARLDAPHGAFFVTGNHEYYSGARDWISEIRRLGLKVLLNEHVVLAHKGSDVVVAGVTDYNAGHFDPAHHSDPAAAIAGAPAGAGINLLLAHQPRSAFAAHAAGYHLQLSGHTHGGQFLPWNFFVRFQQPFTAGLHRLGKLWVYVSRGTGYWGPPKRLGAPSEITRLTLVPA
ncbi:MAG: serine/threonine protein phosphatase [Betaproteobacteria bacterium]|nr:serine/threonine protein phosphatase [Betaproteobacteria bacterium]